MAVTITPKQIAQRRASSIVYLLETDEDIAKEIEEEEENKASPIPAKSSETIINKSILDNLIAKQEKQLAKQEKEYARVSKICQRKGLRRPVDLILNMQHKRDLIFKLKDVQRRRNAGIVCSKRSEHLWRFNAELAKENWWLEALGNPKIPYLSPKTFRELKTLVFSLFECYVCGKFKLNPRYDQGFSISSEILITPEQAAILKKKTKLVQECQGQ